MTLLQRLAAFSVLGMFFLLISGALVTTTGSEDGCGTAWPNCDGDWSTLATWIEVNHRVITGVLGLSILALSVLAWRQFGGRREIRRLIILALVLLVLQSWLGAVAVMWGSSEAVMAGHFGVSLASFGSVFLLAVRIRQLETGRTYRNGPVPPRFRGLLWANLVLLAAVVYVGAYLRHAEIGLACPGWPLCNNALIPAWGTPEFTNMVHRALAGALLLLTAVTGHLTRPYRHQRPDLFWGSVAAVALVVLQALSGWLVVDTLGSVAANVLHSSWVTLYTGALLFLMWQAVPEKMSAREPQAAAV